MGIEHFRTPVSKGIEIIEGLRGHTSGYAVPTFVVDAPGGGGKTPVMPQYVISQTPHKVILRNYEGVITTYTEPQLCLTFLAPATTAQARRLTNIRVYPHWAKVLRSEPWSLRTWPDTKEINTNLVSLY